MRIDSAGTDPLANAFAIVKQERASASDAPTNELEPRRGYADFASGVSTTVLNRTHARTARRSVPTLRRRCCAASAPPTSFANGEAVDVSLALAERESASWASKSLRPGGGMADTTVLEAVAVRRAGSSPVLGTISPVRRWWIGSDKGSKRWAFRGS